MGARYFLVACSALLGSTIVAAVDSPFVADSEEAACEILKVAVAKARLGSEKPDPYWYCDHTGGNQRYYIIALRSSRPRPDMEGAIYSNLAGWFAVEKNGRQAFNWDINENQIAPLN